MRARRNNVGRKRKETLAREREVREHARRVTRFFGMTDALCDKVERSLADEETSDPRDLKQLSSILKELMTMQDICPAEERRERELRVKKLSREVAEGETREVTVKFVGGEDAWGK